MAALETREFNLIVLGDSNVGKTTMIESVANKMSTEQTSKGNYHFKYELGLNSNKAVYFNTWEVDCDKHNNFDSQKCDAVIFMYDITNLKSFKSLEDWILKLNHNSKQQLVMIMVGNKSDCSGRQVKNNEAFEFAKKHNINLLETSAKMGSNIDALFKEVSYQLSNKIAYFPEGENVRLIANNSSYRFLDWGRRTKNCTIKILSVGVTVGIISTVTTVILLRTL
jgi:small GTP-binding protein